MARLARLRRGYVAERDGLYLTLYVNSLEKRLCVHVFRLWKTHQLQDGRSYIAEGAVLYALDLIAGIDNDELNRIERVCCVRSAVIVNCVISIAMVCGDENHVVVLDGLGNDLLDAAVNASDSGADGIVNSGVADHVAVT